MVRVIQLQCCVLIAMLLIASNAPVTNQAVLHEQGVRGLWSKRATNTECAPSEPCGWVVPNLTLNYQEYVKNVCECRKNTSCVRDTDLDSGSRSEYHCLEISAALTTS